MKTDGIGPPIHGPPGPLDPQRVAFTRVPLPGRPTLGATLVAGTGLPLLFLHPNRTNRRVFDFVIAAATLPNPVVVAEYRGHGDSDRPTEGYDLDSHLGDIEALIDVLGLDEFAVVGQATGATLGLLLATRRPEAVEALALGNLAIAIRPEVNDLVQTHVATRTDFGSRAEAAAATPVSERWRPEVMEHWLDTALEQRADGRYRWRYYPPGVAETEAALLADLWPRIDVAAPVLLFRGAESDIIPAAAIDDAAGRLPDAERAELPRANHRLAQDNPEGFAQLVTGFFRRRGVL